MEEELRQRFGAKVEVELVAGTGGIYEISVNGKTIFSKRQMKRFPQSEEIMKLVEAEASKP